MGLLCFLSPIFHRGCSPTGERNISLWFAAAALPHPQLHNEGTWRIKSHREQQVCGGQGAGTPFGSSPDLPPACPKQCPPQAPLPLRAATSPSTSPASSLQLPELLKPQQEYLILPFPFQAGRWKKIPPSFHQLLKPRSLLSLAFTRAHRR